MHTGADIEAGASTPLMEAAQEGHVEIVKFLIKKGKRWSCVCVCVCACACACVCVSVHACACVCVHVTVRVVCVHVNE